MNKKEVAEIRRHFTPNNCTATRICGCYVDHEKNKKFETREAFLSLPEEEEFKERIRKEGADVTFYYWGKYYKYHIPEIENMKCAKVQVSIKAWKNRTGNKFLYDLGLNRFTYQKMHVDKWKDIPNRFRSGDVITIDGDKGKFYVNGMNRQQDEILGTQYFKVDPGTSEIKFRVSEWTKTDPTIKVYIREAWLRWICQGLRY